MAANALHQDAVGVAEQAEAQRQPSRVRKLSSGMCQGFYIVTDLLDIVRPVALLGGLEGEDVAEGGLRPFALRGDDRFLADEAVEEPIGAGNHGVRYGQTGEGRLCLRVEVGCRPIDHEGRVGRRQRVGNERPDLLAEGTCDAIVTGSASHG